MPGKPPESENRTAAGVGIPDAPGVVLAGQEIAGRHPNRRVRPTGRNCGRGGTGYRLVAGGLAPGVAVNPATGFPSAVAHTRTSPA